MEYPVKRELDGAYFRVERNGKWENVCFCDLTLEERFKVMEGRSVEWLKSMCIHLANTVQVIGEQFDICAAEPD